MDEPLLWLGTLLCALAAAAGLVPVAAPPDAAGRPDPRRRGRSRRCLVLADSWDSTRIADLRDRPALLLVAAIAAAAGIVIGGWIFRRRPTWLAPALVAAMPFRIPIDLGGGDANLLLPLYAVIACGLAATLYGAWRDPAPEPERAPEAPEAPRAPVGMVARRGRVGARRCRRPLRAPGRLRRRHHARTPERRLLPRPVRRSLPAPGRGPLGPAGDAGDRLGAGDRGAGLPARRRRRVRVRRAALERQGDLRQRGPHLLPRQLAVLGPEHPRPLPGGDDDRAGGDRRLRTAPERGPRRGGVLRAVPRPARRQLLADEHPGPARGAARPRRRPLGARPRHRRRRRDARSRWRRRSC